VDEVVPPIHVLEQAAASLSLVVFAILMGLSIGALYEVYEYVANQWLGAEIAIGYSDTIFDLTLDAAGSFAGGVLWAAARLPTGRLPLA
jgi:hypothetical protein